MTTFQGRCHCGSITFRYSTDRPPSEWSVRACQCTFCRAHHALSTSDPQGRLEFHAAHPDRLTRYRFGLRTADFLLCSQCGVYVGALTEVGGRTFGIINVNALSPIPDDVSEPKAMTYEG